MIRLLCALLAQDGSGGASSLGCAQECECGSLFIIFRRGEGGGVGWGEGGGGSK